MTSPRCRILLWISATCAIAVAIFAVTAGWLGADSDGKWGAFRIGLLALGVGWPITLLGLQAIDALDRRLIGRRTSNASSDAQRRGKDARVSPTGPPGALVAELSLPSSRGTGGHGRVKRLAGLVLFVVAVEMLYVWFASATLMSHWPRTSQVYGLLAESFSKGRVDLPVEPPVALAEVENPYDASQRAGIQIYADASYFGGRYYAYWGPAPALFVAAWQVLFGQPVGDEHVAFVATTLAFLFTVLVLYRLRSYYFPNLPGWLMGVGLLVVAVAHPVLWNLSSPAIYEAAIASGQAFLLAGLFFALPAMAGRDPRWPEVALAGWLWGLAVACRLTLAPAVGVLLTVTVSRWAGWGSRTTSWRALRRGLFALVLPAALVFGALAAYNYARFGSVTETGLKYQLQPRWDYTLLARTGGIFNLRYVAPNLLYYGFAPVRPRPEFPFLGPLRGGLPAVNQFLRNLQVPQAYSVEDITGLGMAVPYATLGFLLLWGIFCRGLADESSTDSSARPVRREGENPLGVGLALMFAAGVTALPILAYRHVASRFMLDFVPMLVVASTIGVWQFSNLDRRPVGGKLLRMLVLAAAAVTVVVSILLAFSGPASRIDDFNPALWDRLTQIRLW